MTIAAEARAAALSFEAKKDGLSQLQDGSWVLKLKVHPNEIPAALLTAGMGTRFMSVLVEIGDDETPVPKQEQAARAKPVKDKKRWSELPPSQQAAIRCTEPGFRLFLAERNGSGGEISEAMAAEIVRQECGVRSRADITVDHPSGGIWEELDADYQFWLRHPEAA